MFCATLLVAGQCAFTCSGDLADFQKAWNIRWDNRAQAIVDDQGPVSQLRRMNGETLWTVEAEPASCTGSAEANAQIESAESHPRIEAARGQRPQPR